MGSLKRRIITFIVWILLGVTMCIMFKKGLVFIPMILSAPFLTMGIGMGILLWGEPLPPRKGDICQQCKFRFATVTKNYWAYGYTIPSGGVKLCDECANRYDPHYDWGKDKLFNR